MQAPGLQAITQETPRVLTRGKLEYFVFEFFYDPAKQQPVIPYDPQSYPNYSVISPSGNILAQGIAIPGPMPGVWKLGWVVPKNAELTTPNKRYKFQSIMVDSQLRQFEISFMFDMVEDAVPAQAPMESTSISYECKSVRLFFRNTVRPSDLSVDVIVGGSNVNVFHASFVYPIPANPGPNNILEAEDGTGYVYYVDTPVLGAGTFSAVWSVRDTVVSTMDYEHQTLQVVPANSFLLMNSLRMFIDKLQKKLGLVYAYTDADILEYIIRGTGLINAYQPPSDYSFTNYPNSLEAYILMASAWWGLTAQRILYAETNLSFSGQTVTLEYNPGADLEGILSSFKETLDTQVPKTKTSLLRQSSAVGSLSVRPYRYAQNRVFQVGNNKGPLVLNQVLAYWGLLD